ncbi:uncharacterized protein L969DRAFT_15744 [Mixia osmundae IAM 14324]|uniref:uncharacterized protein n=1 Tax=Mixia osmundae (strain CBS 9802 / IAM 14324 / JCM 22182 / KY 12970) TaxID=764103 RepID=UPI0004A54954|nr:uncharacterized protein L969DRAFT_15744 [Mixia osmundae IAM 14324]KEI41727.1 hypothetical protein L969DRAFT_15744 [Mixia osmundae IAM 14324]
MSHPDQRVRHDGGKKRSLGGSVRELNALRSNAAVYNDLTPKFGEGSSSAYTQKKSQSPPIEVEGVPLPAGLASRRTSVPREGSVPRSRTKTKKASPVAETISKMEPAPAASFYEHALPTASQASRQDTSTSSRSASTSVTSSSADQTVVPTRPRSISKDKSRSGQIETSSDSEQEADDSSNSETSTDEEIDQDVKGTSRELAALRTAAANIKFETRAERKQRRRERKQSDQPGSSHSGRRRRAHVKYDERSDIPPGRQSSKPDSRSRGRSSAASNAPSKSRSSRNGARTQAPAPLSIAAFTSAASLSPDLNQSSRPRSSTSSKSGFGSPQRERAPARRRGDPQKAPGTQQSSSRRRLSDQTQPNKVAARPLVMVSKGVYVDPNSSSGGEDDAEGEEVATEQGSIDLPTKRTKSNSALGSSSPVADARPEGAENTLRPRDSSSDLSSLESEYSESASNAKRSTLKSMLSDEKASAQTAQPHSDKRQSLEHLATPTQELDGISHTSSSITLGDLDRAFERNNAASLARFGNSIGRESRSSSPLSTREDSEPVNTGVTSPEDVREARTGARGARSAAQGRREGSAITSSKRQRLEEERQQNEALRHKLLATVRYEQKLVEAGTHPLLTDLLTRLQTEKQERLRTAAQIQIRREEEGQLLLYEQLRRVWTRWQVGRAVHTGYAAADLEALEQDEKRAYRATFVTCQDRKRAKLSHEHFVLEPHRPMSLGYEPPPEPRPFIALDDPARSHLEASSRNALQAHAIWRLSATDVMTDLEHMTSRELLMPSPIARPAIFNDYQSDLLPRLQQGLPINDLNAAASRATDAERERRNRNRQKSRYAPAPLHGDADTSFLDEAASTSTGHRRAMRRIEPPSDSPLHKRDHSLQETAPPITKPTAIGQVSQMLAKSKDYEQASHSPLKLADIQPIPPFRPKSVGDEISRVYKSRSRSAQPEPLIHLDNLPPLRHQHEHRPAISHMLSIKSAATSTGQANPQPTSPVTVPRTDHAYRNPNYYDGYGKAQAGSAVPGTVERSADERPMGQPIQGSSGDMLSVVI